MTSLETATDAPSRAAQRKNPANIGAKPRGSSGKKKPAEHDGPAGRMVVFVAAYQAMARTARAVITATRLAR